MLIAPDAVVQDVAVVDVDNAVGLTCTTTGTVPAALVQPPAVTVTLYVPAIATVEPVMVGFWLVLLKELGPLHAYVAPETAAVDRLMSLPAQTGLLLGAGVAGVVFTTTVAVPATDVQPPTVTVMLYVPAMAVVALVLFGLRVALV